MQRGGQFDESTLLIWGDLDRAVGLSSGRQLASMLPQSSLLVIPRRRTHRLRGDAGCLQPGDERLADQDPCPRQATLS